ncbi:SnoaL-like domain-containing protein [Maribacter sp. 2210JD10-5]|uniref:SnoaL-like domain-containing protein n=1 Tax=Maribacter sp. 2210JD10-5 TaxID=3386272 RepID=UPI0039BD6C91
MTTKEVADKLVGYCRQGQFDNAMKELYGQDIVSIEPKGAPMEKVEGFKAVMEKAEFFNNMVAEFHGNEVSEPLVADNFFSCRMKMDATFKQGGRQAMEEICLYQVENGKIVKEEFFYTPAPRDC